MTTTCWLKTPYILKRGLSPAFFKYFILIADCDDPGVPVNGEQETVPTYFYHTSVVTFTCNSGYVMEGSSSTTCYDGVWNNQLPTCVTAGPSDCTDPGPFPNGDATGEFTHGSYVSFDCHSGYTLEGPDYIQCDNGVWSEDIAVCRADCADPGVPINGEQETVPTYFYHTSVVTFTCNYGYVMEGSSSTTCYDGVWNNPLPTCVTSGPSDCTDPGPFPNGDATGEFTHGSYVSFDCHSGYTLEGPDYIQCDNGVWSEDIAVCRADCLDPGVPANGEQESVPTYFYHTSVVTFTCNIGYVMEGSSSTTCYDGVWNNPLPTCTY
ncbi:P-selectin-like [Ptychodera flava]|uniref:P-selectin-like n=1 Tax=Ptychodera flava TaxID=63121 RepID=UPI003969F5A1